MENKKVLVAFFSRTGENFFPGGNRFIEKGNTHIAAEMVSEVCGSELFEIKALEPYSDNYRECAMRAKQEVDANARPALLFPSSLALTISLQSLETPETPRSPDLEFRSFSISSGEIPSFFII